MYRRILLAAALLIALACAARAEGENFTGFDDLGLTVTVTVNADGSAHVKEDVQLIVYPNAMDLYKQSLLSTRLTIRDWTNTTGSKNLRGVYHVFSANASPVNTRVFPQPLQRMQFVNRSTATITVEYDTSGPIFVQSALGPRRTRFALDPNALAFEPSPEGQILSENTVLSITLPPNSQVDLDRTFPRLSTPQGSGASSARTYVWNATGGAIPLSPIEFSFEMRQSLDDEVSAYFAALEASVMHLVFSNYGAVALVLAAVLAGTYFALKQMKAF